MSPTGYPLASALQAQSTSFFGVYVGVQIPSQSSYTGGPNGNGNVRLIWTITGAGATDQASWLIGLIGQTPVSSGVISGTGSVTGSTSTGNGTFYYIFTPLYGNPSAVLNFKYPNNLGTSTAQLTSVALVFDGGAGSDYALWSSGKIFNTQFLNRIALLGAGVWRFMDWWSTNVGNMSTWATRKSVGYVTYGDYEYRAALSAGTTSGNTGNNYTITVPGSYTWPGYTTGGVAVDKQTMHLLFNTTGTFVANLNTAFNPSTNVFTWNSHGLSNGNPVVIEKLGNGSGLVASPMANYFIVNATTNTFQVAAVAGGSPISFGATSTGASVTLLATLTIDGVHQIPMRPYYATTIPQSGNDMPTAGSGSQIWTTLVYDASLNCWYQRGNTTDSAVGLDNGVPPEICFELCKELGMHPHFSIPGFALDPMTDFVPSLAAYCKADSSSKANGGWMIPHYEPGNEIWAGTGIANYGIAKAFSHWAIQQDPHNWYGKILSTTGQACATVYGFGNLGTTYEVMCGCKTDDLFPTNGGQDPRLTAAAWIAAGTPTQGGYTVTAPAVSGTASAGGWASSVLVTTYVSPTMRGYPAEFTNAWQYFMVNGGTYTAAPSGGSAAMQNLNNFVDTLGGVAGAVTTNGSTSTSSAVIHVASVPAWVTSGMTVVDYTTSASGVQTIGTILSIGTGTITLTGNAASAVGNGDILIVSAAPMAPYNNDYVAARFTGFKLWGAKFGINKMFAYEGGYSPDLMQGPGGSNDWNSSISAATKASQCVLTLPTSNGGDIGNGINCISGTIAATGMCLFITGVSDMTQLNTNDGFRLFNLSPGLRANVGDNTFTTDGSTPFPNTVVVNQGIVFQGPLPGGQTNYPTNIQFNIPYFIVNATSTSIQISATKGGSPITLTGASGVSFFIQTYRTGWMVTNVTGNFVTIDCNSTGFTAFATPGSCSTAGSSATALYAGSMSMCNFFRYSTIQFASDLPTQLNANFNNFTMAGGLFPSQYQFSGIQSIWDILQPDIWAAPSQAFLQQQHYNGH